MKEINLINPEGKRITIRETKHKEWQIIKSDEVFTFQLNMILNDNIKNWIKAKGYKKEE